MFLKLQNPKIQFGANTIGREMKFVEEEQEATAMATSRVVQGEGSSKSCSSMGTSSLLRSRKMYCGCGDEAIKYTANSDANRGRSFWRCPNWNVNESL